MDGRIRVVTEVLEYTAHLAAGGQLEHNKYLGNWSLKFVN